MQNNSFLPFIKDTLETAGEIARHNFGRVTNVTKTGDNNQVLTETDLEIGKLMVNAVQKAYPSHNVIDEEAGAIEKGSKYTWVIDPIDGTSNFANAVPTYGIMIGLLEGGKPVAAGIALPSLDDLYLGAPGHGATRNGNPIAVSPETKLLSSLVAYGIDGHQEDPKLTYAETETLARIVLGIRNLRTNNSCFDSVMVAQGSYGASLNQTSKIWDNVAQQAIIEAAGGIYTDFSGQPIDYSHPTSKITQNFTWCSGSPALHRAVQAIVHL